MTRETWVNLEWGERGSDLITDKEHYKTDSQAINAISMLQSVFINHLRDSQTQASLDS